MSNIHIVSNPIMYWLETYFSTSPRFKDKFDNLSYITISSTIYATGKSIHTEVKNLTIYPAFVSDIHFQQPFSVQDARSASTHQALQRSTPTSSNCLVATLDIDVYAPPALLNIYKENVRILYQAHYKLIHKDDEHHWHLLRTVRLEEI
jgi:hypothetical protein